MNRGEVWLGEVGGKVRPVVVLTRDAVIDVRTLVAVAEVTRSIRGLAAEVPVDENAGLDHSSVINCDGLHTVAQRTLTRRLGEVDDDTMRQVCWAIGFALGC